LTGSLSADTQANKPFLDLRADDVGMILLQIVNARRKLYQFAVLKILCEARAERRRYKSTRISYEKQL
jgi:hypothetical protein